MLKILAIHQKNEFNKVIHIVILFVTIINFLKKGFLVGYPHFSLKNVDNFVFLLIKD